ncbi:hypothetical protein [Roseicyclus marinus]|uniref:hypothetical protein n=1 Tax=Roseicyclus marinus TaxID=2161673 RepID=UPI002410972D|nr:hypothetical protein [Roseicyclus marinus]MDG3040465.1 hypothetical protein [Roseicyclus marinus]
MIIDDRTRAELRKLARQGKLIDEAFKAYQRKCHATATSDQIGELRRCFFAGAAELVALLTAGADTTSADEVSAEEEAMVFAVFTEVTRFHDRTLGLAFSKPRGQA